MQLKHESNILGKARTQTIARHRRNTRQRRLILLRAAFAPNKNENIPHGRDVFSLGADAASTSGAVPQIFLIYRKLPACQQLFPPRPRLCDHAPSPREPLPQNEYRIVRSLVINVQPRRVLDLVRGNGHHGDASNLQDGGKGLPTPIFRRLAMNRR